MSSVVGNSLTIVAATVAQELGPCELFTTTGNGGGTTQVASPLLDSEAPTGKYGGFYLYNYSDAAPNSLLGQQGRVTRNGYNGATGVFTVAAPFTATPHTAAGWMLLGTMPVLDQDGLIGIRSCVNRAIQKLWTRIWYPLTAVDGQTEYDLGALWFADRSRFVRLMDPDPGGSGLPTVAGQGWDVVQNGDVWTLQLSSSYPDGQTFWLVLDAPTNFRLKISGVWANQSSPNSGMSLGADACLGSWNHVLQCTLYECAKQLAKQAGGNRKEYWQNEVDKPGGYRSIVAAIKGFQMDDDGDGLGEGPSIGPGSWGSAWGSKGLFGL